MAGAAAMETQGVKVMNFQKNIHYSCLIPSRDLQRVLQICKGIKEIPNELGSQNRGTIDIVYCTCMHACKSYKKQCQCNSSFRTSAENSSIYS